MADQPNPGESADPSSDTRQQPHGTTTADLTARGGDQDPAAPTGSDDTGASGEPVKVTGPGEGAEDDIDLGHSPSGG